VEYILLNPQQFAQVNEAVLRTGKAQLEHQLEEVNDQAIKFARNLIKSVNVLDFPSIALALPMRVVEPKSAIRHDHTCTPTTSTEKDKNRRNSTFKIFEEMTPEEMIIIDEMTKKSTGKAILMMNVD
jgi:hypothetical protein